MIYFATLPHNISYNLKQFSSLSLICVMRWEEGEGGGRFLESPEDLSSPFSSDNLGFSANNLTLLQKCFPLQNTKGWKMVTEYPRGKCLNKKTRGYVLLKESYLWQQQSGPLLPWSSWHTQVYRSHSVVGAKTRPPYGQGQVAHSYLHPRNKINQGWKKYRNPFIYPALPFSPRQYLNLYTNEIS